MKVPTDVLEALDRAETDGPRLVLTGPRMDPKLYARIDEVLEAIGGKWISGEGAHLFAKDAATAVQELRRTGTCTTAREAVQLAQFFPTPAAVVAELLAAAEAKPDMQVLEPSAGHGAIARALVEAGCLVDCIEKETVHAEILNRAGCARTLTVEDFLTIEPRPIYDRVVMNPPFTRGADIAHVTHALGFLHEEGRLVSVMSSGVAWQAPAANFRAMVAERGGSVVPLPEQAFQESGTSVGTFLVVIPARRPVGEVPSPIWPGQQKAPERVLVDLPPPAVIARQIEADLKTALRHFAAVAKSLEAPPPDPVDGQLAIDL